MIRRVSIALIALFVVGCGASESSDTGGAASGGNTPDAGADAGADAGPGDDATVEPEACDPEGDDECVELQSNVLNLDQENAFETVIVEHHRLRLWLKDGAELPEQIAEGGVVFGGDPNGKLGKQDAFMRRITAVMETPTNEVVIETEQAPLTAVIRNARLKRQRYKPAEGKDWDDHRLEPCSVDADCVDSCPPGAPDGCVCGERPDGKLDCRVACASDEDCAKPGAYCRPQGFCSLPMGNGTARGKADGPYATMEGGLTTGLLDCAQEIPIPDIEGDDGQVDFTLELTQCHFQLVPDVDIEVNINRKGLKYLYLSVGGDVDVLLEALAAVSASYHKENEIDLLTVSFPLRFFIGVVPVRFDFQITLYAGYLVSFTGEASVTTGFQFQHSIEMGIEYEKGNGWRTFFHTDSSKTQLGPFFEVEAELTARAWIRPELAILLYGVAGPTLDFTPYLQLDGWITEASLEDATLQTVALCTGEAQTLTKELCWDLDAGYQASIGIYLELFGKELSKDSWNWVLTEKNIDIADNCLDFELPYDMSNFDCEDYLEQHAEGGTDALPQCFMDSDCETEINCNIQHCVDNTCTNQANLAEAYASCCNTDDDCDDDNPCTNDICSGEGISAHCAHTSINADTSDGLCCITAADCDDDKDDTTDSCEDGQCVHDKNTGGPNSGGPG